MIGTSYREPRDCRASSGAGVSRIKWSQAPSATIGHRHSGHVGTSVSTLVAPVGARDHRHDIMLDGVERWSRVGTG